MRGCKLMFFFLSWFCLSYLVYQGSLNFIIYFYFPILKQLTYVSYCFISINNGLLVVKRYSSLVVSGFSEINLIHCQAGFSYKTDENISCVPPPERYFQPITTSSILPFCFCEQTWHFRYVMSTQMLSHLPSAVFVEDMLHQRQLKFRLNEDLITTALVRFLCFLQIQSELFWSTVSSYPFLVHENQDHVNFGLTFNKNA
jgi:hypothetical protein